MYGAYKDDTPCTLKYAEAMTAVSCPDGSTVLIGVKKIVWIDHPEQKESLLNTHHIWNAAVEINNRLCIHGGEQQMIIGGQHILLDFMDNLTISLHSCLPSNDELNLLPTFIVSTRFVDRFPQQRFMTRRKSAIDAAKERSMSPIAIPSLPTAPLETVPNLIKI